MKRLSLFVAALLAATLGCSSHAMVAVPLRQPAPPPGWVYQWCPPVYRATSDRTWIPASSQLVPDWLETSPGHWEQIWRQVSTPGHYQITTRQVLVFDGYWQLVRLDPPPFPLPHPIVIAPGTVGVEGYPTAAEEDLHRFSPLTEWPDHH